MKIYSDFDYMEERKETYNYYCECEQLNLSDEDIDFLTAEYMENSLKQMLDYVDRYEHYIISGTIQRWNGTKSGYGVIDNLSRLLDWIYRTCGNCDIEIYTHKKNLCVDAAHHDGINHFIIKGFDIPEDVSDKKYNRLVDCVKGYDTFKKSDKRMFYSLGAACESYWGASA